MAVGAPRRRPPGTGADERFRAAAISTLDGENVDAASGQLCSPFARTSTETAPEVFMGQFRIIDVADLNGDGRMELVAGSWYYEGAGVHVFDYGADDQAEDGTESMNLAIANVCGY